MTVIKYPETILLCMLLKTPDVKFTPQMLTNINWTFFYKLIIRHRLWHRLCNTLETQLNADITPDIQLFLSSLKQYCRHDTLRLMVLCTESLRLSAAFSTHHLQHAFIKGITLNDYLYGNLNTRPCKDIDLLVHPESYDEAAQLLLASGYKQQEPLYSLEGLKKKYHFKHRHDVAFYHPQKKILVELHFKLEYPGINFFSFQDIPLKQLPMGNKSITTLDDDYHLLFLMLHGAIHGWNRLRWLEDIYLFIQLKQGDLARLRQLAMQLQCVHVVEQALLLVTTFFQCESLNLERHLKNTSAQGKSLAAIAQTFITSDYEQIDGLKKPSLFFLYRYYRIKLAPKYKKSTMLFADIFKIYNLFPDFTFSDRFFWLYYLAYPWWIIKYIITGFRK